MFYVEIKEKETENLVETVLKTESHDESCRAVNEYNKEYGAFGSLLKKYPKKKYFIAVNKDKTR